MYLCFLGGLVSIEKNTQDNIITLNRVIEILNKNDVIQFTAAPVVNNIIDDVQILGGTRL